MLRAVPSGRSGASDGGPAGRPKSPRTSRSAPLVHWLQTLYIERHITSADIRRRRLRPRRKVSRPSTGLLLVRVPPLKRIRIRLETGRGAAMFRLAETITADEVSSRAEQHMVRVRDGV